MKFRWKPPFFHITGNFDLHQTNPNLGLLTDKPMKASYRSISDEEELFKSKPGSTKKLTIAQAKDVSQLYKIETEFKNDKKHRFCELNKNTSAADEYHNFEYQKREKCCTDIFIVEKENNDEKINGVVERKRFVNRKRFGVSAGSTDEWDRQKNRKEIGNGCEVAETAGAVTKITKYTKNKEIENLIKDAIMNNEFLRESLGDKEVMQAIVDAMYTRRISADNSIIREGEIGSHLYVCEKGSIGIYKNEKKINTLGPGRIFGELALLCNTKRNATVRAITPCTLWVLDRAVFNEIVKGVETRRVQENVNYLRSVKIFKKIDDDALRKITDLLKMRIFPSDTKILKQGEEGNLFYIITAGTVKVTVKNVDGSEKTLGTLGKGDFFGEGALIARDKRTATVTAQTLVECLTLDREPFIQFLGGLEEVQKVMKSRVARLKNITEKSSEYSFIKLEDLDERGTLGIGGFGRVELVEYKKNRNLTFALKRLSKNHIVAFQQQVHVLNEKNTMCCCHSPFIVRLFNTYRDNKYLYFLMEACLGGDVWSLLQKRRFFDEKTAKFITACVVGALQHLHDRGIIYRDLKPENLVFDAKGYVKLVDFGFAKKINATEKTWTFAGTPEYLAPEIVRNKGHDRAVDYWALGVFIYELLVGRPPFRGADYIATYNLILKGISSTPFPKFITKSAEILIKKLCKNEPTERLGYQREGIEGIKAHKWFIGFKWDALEKTKLPAPYVPKINGPVDLSNFEECPKDKDVPPDEFGDWDINF